MRLSRFASAAVLGAGLLAAGCAASTPGTAPTAFDGEYSGTRTFIHVGANSCASTEPQPGKLVVQNGTVAWPSSPTLTLYAPVMQNGAFQATQNAVIFTGKITNHEMVARVNTGSCHVIYDLRRPT